MSAIGKGDWVECICTAPGATFFQVGSLYCVAAIEAPRARGCEVCDGSCVGLKVERQPRERWLAGCCFRPIYRPNAELIADLLRRSNEPMRPETPEPADAARKGAPLTPAEVGPGRDQ